MLELYHAYSDLFGIMELTEGLIVVCADALGGRQRQYGEHTVNLQPPFQRATYSDLFRQHVGCDLFDASAVQAAATAADIPLALAGVAKEHDVLVQELFEHYVEKELVGPVFVYNYPAALCPLTKRCAVEPRLAERFELYVRGMELANAYTELNDPVTQEATFRRQLAGLGADDQMAKMDDDFIRALRHGMPPAGGLGVGIDRLVMLLTDTPSIRDVILFPLLRPHASAVVKRVRYDEGCQTLAIQFPDGDVYEYAGVPPEVHLELQHASSQGGYFNAHIKGKFAERRVI
jgi:lysyl-tRNA synthetase class 2